MRPQSFANREARKPKRREGKRVAAYKIMIDAAGNLVERDDSEFCCWLYCHGETEGGAWLVSTTGWWRDRFTLPKRLADQVGEPAGGITLRGQLVPIVEFSMPRFIAIEKRLAA